MGDEEEKIRKLRIRLRRRHNFYMGLFTYVWVNILLLVVNLVTSPQDLWFYWVTIIWGIALLAEGINAFSIRERFIGEDWEERKIQEYLHKEKAKKK